MKPPKGMETLPKVLAAIQRHNDRRPPNSDTRVLEEWIDQKADLLFWRDWHQGTERQAGTTTTHTAPKDRPMPAKKPAPPKPKTPPAPPAASPVQPVVDRIHHLRSLTWSLLSSLEALDDAQLSSLQGDLDLLDAATHAARTVLELRGVA